MSKRPDVIIRNRSKKQREKNSASWKDPQKRAVRLQSIYKANETETVKRRRMAAIKKGWQNMSEDGKNKRKSGLTYGKHGFKKGQIPWNKGLTVKTSEEVASYGKKSGQSRKGKPNGWRGKKRPGAREAMLEKIASGKMKKCFNTKPELAMKKILDNAGIEYEFQRRLGNFCFDFVIEGLKLVIEVDGEYWHNYPHGTDKDRIKDEYLKLIGYRVVRVWGNDALKGNFKPEAIVNLP